jgi:hypothetical protein
VASFFGLERLVHGFPTVDYTQVGFCDGFEKTGQIFENAAISRYPRAFGSRKSGLSVTGFFDVAIPPTIWASREAFACENGCNSAAILNAAAEHLLGDACFFG